MHARVLQPELLEGAEESAADASLRDLRRINRFLGGHRIIRGLFRALEARAARFTVLDIGAASGDMGASLRRAFPSAHVISLDRVWYHLRAAAPPRVSADAFRLPFRDRSFDYVTCSLFLHHFSDDQVIDLLAHFRRIARRGVVIIDLERAPVFLHSLPITSRALGWCAITRHDARASVAAAFRPDELAQLARAAGAPSVRVRRHLPWGRISVVLGA